MVRLCSATVYRMFNKQLAGKTTALIFRKKVRGKIALHFSLHAANEEKKLSGGKERNGCFLPSFPI